MNLGTPIAEIVLALAAFMVGGIPFGWLVARVFKGIDLRTIGSGSVGATNASRLWSGPASIGMFLVVFALDFGKGLLVALGSKGAAAAVGHALESETSATVLQVLCGMCAILGHVFTPYLRFKGGKGVATAFGVVTALAPVSALCGLGAWAIVLLATRIMSLGSIAAMIVIPLSFVVTDPHRALGSGAMVLTFFVLMAGFVIWSHRSNIARLLRGQERRVGRSDSKT